MKRLGRVLLVTIMLAVGVIGAAAVVSQTAWFRNWLRGYIIREANLYLNGTLTVDRLSGNLFTGVQLANVQLVADGEPVVALKGLELDYSLFEIVTRGIIVNRIALDTPVVYLRRDGDAWQLSRLIKRQAAEADRTGPSRPVTVNEVSIKNGSATLDRLIAGDSVKLPQSIQNLNATLAFRYEPVHYSIDIAHVSFVSPDPALTLNELSGGLAVRDDTLSLQNITVRTSETFIVADGAIEHWLTTPSVQLKVTSRQTSVPELARALPSLGGIALKPSFELSLNGPFSRLNVDVALKSAAGDITAKVLTNTDRPSAAGTIAARHVNLSGITGKPADKSDITADANLDLHAASWADLGSLAGSISVTTPRIEAAGYSADRVQVTAHVARRVATIDGAAAAYGTSATYKGTVRLPEGAPLSYDVSGRARRLDIERLPRALGLPRAQTDVNAAYHVRGSMPVAIDSASDDATSARRAGRRSVRHAAEPNRVWVRLVFEPSTVLGASIAKGGTATVSLEGAQPSYEADLTVAGVDPQRFGTTFNVPALADEAYRGVVNGHITARGSGTAVATLDLDASGTLTDTRLGLGEIPELAFEAKVAHDTADVRAKGSFARLDPEAVSRKPALAGSVDGALDVTANIQSLSAGIQPDRVEAHVNATLSPSTIGKVEIASATLDADYRRSAADVRTLTLAGPDVNVEAAGTVALDERGMSNLSLRADSTNLEQLGSLFGVDVTGMAAIEATVTGNRMSLQANGRVTGNSIAYQGNSALSLVSDVKATVEDLDASRAHVDATTLGVFVVAAGQKINVLTAKTSYQDKTVTFEATATEGQRSMSANGELRSLPEQQEIQLDRLSVTAAGSTWATRDGSSSRIVYKGSTVTVDGLTLENGQQTLDAKGTFGAADDALVVTAQGVDIAFIDSILLRPPQFTGRLDGNATIRTNGASDKTPDVESRFEITNGGFRQFKYESLSGSINYSADGLAIDTKLQQSADAWLTAKGSLPMALLTGAEAGAAEPVNLMIDSSPIDLGLVQGLTTQLTNVAGVLEAHVAVTGTAGRPQPAGTIAVRDGKFSVPATGVAYSGLQGEVQLQADRVHIDEIRVLDNQQEPLTVSGDLALHELELSGVSIAAKAHNFKLVDNELGRVRVDTDLKLTGEINLPRVEGTLAFTTGQINLDAILNAIGPSAYSTTPVADPSSASAAPAAGQPPAATPTPAGFRYEALQVDVHVTWPDDLVVKASDLRAPGAPVSLGALNLTLGGDVWADKAPYDQIRLSGVVNTVRGTYDFQGRRFTILRDGTVKFAGTDELDPKLDIRTERLIQGVTANVNIRGWLSKPEIELSSVPPLEQADILSLIVFNQPINQLGSGQQASLTARAQSIATGAVANGLAQSIGNALNLNVFEIDTAPDSGASAAVTVGQQFGQNLFVKVQQGIGDQSQTNIIVEYELAKWLRLQTNILQGSSVQQQLFQRMQGSGLDLLFFFGR